MRAIARIICAVVGHRLVTRGPLFIEGHYIERLECTRCGAAKREGPS